MKTLLIDLTQDEQTILMGFRKSCRQEVRAAQKQHYVTEVDASPSFSSLNRFFAAYDEFAKRMRLAPCNRVKLTMFAKYKALVLTQVSQPDETHPLYYHAYIHNGLRTRLLHSISCSSTQNSNSLSKKNTSGAHRLLHWHDIKWFKSWGFNYYDLGGLADSEDVHLKNIDHFKRGFGGGVHQEYINATPQSLGGWVAMKLFMKGL